MPDGIEVPAEVAAQAKAALAERAKNEGIQGASRRAVLCALELAQAPEVAAETLQLVGAWHAANPNATTPDGRCTRLAGLYGGASGKQWALQNRAIPTVSWLTEESATLEAFPMVAAADPLIAAGVAVVAADTGRILMMQRCMDPEDPAAGMWEFPGGHIEDGEDPLHGARREFAEETGVACPGMVHMGGWTSPNGVYRLYAHIVESEADMHLNRDHEDRIIGNPDDPHGDNIEVLAWWTAEHAAANPALRPEATWIPFDDIAELGNMFATRTSTQTAALITEAQARAAAYEGLSEDAQKARQRLQDRTLAAAQVAMTDTMRRAGVKVVQRAARRSTAAKSAVAAANGAWTPAVLAAVGVTEQDLIHQAFTTLAEKYDGWVRQSANDQMAAVAAILGIAAKDLIGRMATRVDLIVTAAVHRLTQDLTAWAHRLLADPNPSFGDVGEIPVDATLPLSVLQPSLQIADGRMVAADGQPSGPGLLIDAWQQVDPNPPTEIVTWVCGLPARPFPPHQELDGTTTTWDAYEGDLASEVGDFPRGFGYWYVGDHAGCQCVNEYSYMAASTETAA